MGKGLNIQSPFHIICKIPMAWNTPQSSGGSSTQILSLKAFLSTP